MYCTIHLHSTFHFLFNSLILLFSLFVADMLSEQQQETVDAAAEFLYGLIHARFILTSRGLAAVVCDFVHAQYSISLEKK